MKAFPRKIILLAALITFGIVLELTGLIDVRMLLNLARGYVDQWWLVLLFILLQVVLFTFALAGSFVLWVVAPLYAPAMSTFILAAGGTIGGITAYVFSRHLTEEWAERIESSPVYRLLQKNDSFLILFGLRICPAFPHSLINYSSGILKARLSHFVPAAVLGFSIKFYVYSNAIYRSSSAASPKALLEPAVLWPLLLMSAVILIGAVVRYKLANIARQ